MHTRGSIRASLRPYRSTICKPLCSLLVSKVSIRRLSLSERPRWSHHRKLVGGATVTRRPNLSLSQLSLSASTGATGLFSIPELKDPSDFPRLAQQAIGSCNSIRTDIAAITANPESTQKLQPSEILCQLDDISIHICNVIDAAELCRSVHADPTWREAAQSAHQTLSDFMGHLNSDRNLHNALQLVLDNGFMSLSDEDKTFATLLKAEFERDGVHLMDAGLLKVRDLNVTIGQLEGQFQHNLYHSNEKIAISNVNSVLQLIDPKVLQQSYNATITSKGISIGATQANLLQTIYKYSSDPALRKEVYMGYATALKENVEILEELRRLRHELAITQGFQSFAHRILSDRMAKAPETVQAFLQRAIASNQQSFRRDMEEILLAKKAIEKTSDPVEAWDISFYEHLLEARASEDVQATIASYLTLTKTLEALQHLMKELFDISMTECPMDHMERWDLESQEDDAFVPTKLRKFLFSHNTQGDLGTLYLDLHPREAKYGHPAHYTVRCGCQLNKGHSTLEEDHYQLPIVALVCNLSSRTGAISHAEVETLFHEMGHAVHSLLSRTKYQHVSGTRVAMDFVETPSQFLELFASNENILRDAFDVPHECIQGLMKSRATLSSIETQTQLMYALFDQLLFGAENQSEESSSIFHRVHSELSMPFAQGTQWYARFGHLITYGAGYYGYMYSKGFAMELYRHVLKHGDGQNVWKKLLVYGGSKNPMTMLTDVLGRPPIA